MVILNLTVINIFLQLLKFLFIWMTFNIDCSKKSNQYPYTFYEQPPSY